MGYSVKFSGIRCIRGLRFKLFSIKIHRGNSAMMMSTANELNLF